MPHLNPRRLEQARRAAGLSQAGLARLVGVGRSRIWDWENGRQSPSPRGLATLAAVLGVAVEYLMADDGLSLRALRVRAGLTIAGLAQRVGVPTSTYSGWERAPRQQPQQVVTGLADALRVSPGIVQDALRRQSARP
ncbi:helix-turn-helix domain-containing protein [Amycolatopsis sp. NPDC059657]|uniref:helix-turn-helix domain-containing protein n=1 Tax=Amycolatopsis sp. NPDC059657 TaxID=3346899 RepID=UPI00366F89E1